MENLKAAHTMGNFNTNSDEKKNLFSEQIDDKNLSPAKDLQSHHKTSKSEDLNSKKNQSNLLMTQKIFEETLNLINKIKNKERGIEDERRSCELLNKIVLHDLLMGVIVILSKKKI